MSNSKTLVDNLKRRLRADKITYRELARRLRLSEPTVKRDLSRGTFSLARLDRMCEVLGVSLGDLLQPPGDFVPLTQLSSEQEQALVTQPKLLLVTYLVVNDWKFQEIVTTFQVSENELVSLLLRLERLGIAEFRPPHRMRKLTARNFTWRKDGPVHKFFLERVVPEFFAGRFDGATDELRFIGGTLAAETLRQFKAGIERLANDFEQLARSDARLPLEERNGCSAILGVRSWEFSEFTRLRRAPRKR
jgi:transcriptional regulator with XRE-family HTH domain